MKGAPQLSSVQTDGKTREVLDRGCGKRCVAERGSDWTEEGPERRL